MWTLTIGVFGAFIFLPIIFAIILRVGNSLGIGSLGNAMLEALKNIPLFGFIVDLVTYNTPGVLTSALILDKAEEAATLIVIFLIGDKSADFIANIYSAGMIEKKNFIENTIIFPVVKLAIDIIVRFVVVLVLSFITTYSKKAGGEFLSLWKIYAILIVAIIITVHGNTCNLKLSIVEIMIPILSAINIMGLCLAVYGFFGGMGGRARVGGGICVFIGVAAWIGMRILKGYVKKKKS